MNGTAKISKDGKSITVRIPLTFHSRSARKFVIVPDGTPPWRSPSQKPDNAIITALARAHRWKRLLESGEYASVAELAKADGVNFSYLCRVLRLTLLSPKIVEAILNGTAAPELQLRDLLQPLPPEWGKQQQGLS